MPHIHQISVSPPPRGGVPKLPVLPNMPVRITRNGVEGDWQHDRKHHGGPDRAVCLFSLEVIHRLQSEGHPITPGAAGENLTITGLDWPALTPGPPATRLLIGAEPTGPILEIVSYTQPCSTIRNAFTNLDFRRIKHELHPGESRLYARVLREGLVTTLAPCHIIL